MPASSELLAVSLHLSFIPACLLLVAAAVSVIEGVLRLACHIYDFSSRKCDDVTPYHSHLFVWLRACANLFGAEKIVKFLPFNSTFH